MVITKLKARRFGTIKKLSPNRRRKVLGMTLKCPSVQLSEDSQNFIKNSPFNN